MWIDKARVLPGLVGLVLGLGPATAIAANGTKQRIPPDFADEPCITVVDRSVDPVAHIEWTIIMEDAGELLPDEVEDSRRHQFFGFCRAHSAQTFLPRWITQSDIDRAIAVSQAPDNIEPEDILESSTEWADCWHRINPDDARLPITFANAEAGIEWDTSSLSAGTYVVGGYTWEPAFNVWTRSPGVIKVVDDPALEASGPAHAITNGEELLYKNESVTIEGCVSVMPGATATGYWARADPDVEWIPFIEDDPISDQSYALEFSPPDEVAGESVMIRVDVTDPMGRSYTNYMHELVIVLGTDGMSCEDESGGGFIGGADCEPGGGTADTAGSGDSATTDMSGPTSGPLPGQEGGDGGGGCTCRSSTSSTPPTVGLLLLGLWAWRRRSREIERPGAA